MLKLTTYRRDQFPNLKAKLEEDGYTYASAMELGSTQKLASLCSEGPVGSTSRRCCRSSIPPAASTTPHPSLKF